MGGDEVARKDASDLMGWIEGHIDEKLRRAERYRGLYALVDRIVVELHPGRLRVIDQLCTVERPNGLQSGQSWNDAFGTSREAREEVGLDEASDDAHIGLQVVPIDPDRHPCRCRTDLVSIDLSVAS